MRWTARAVWGAGLLVLACGGGAAVGDTASALKEICDAAPPAPAWWDVPTVPTLLALRDAGGPMPAGAVLLSPGTDHVCSVPLGAIGAQGAGYTWQADLTEGADDEVVACGCATGAPSGVWAFALACLAVSARRRPTSARGRPSTRRAPSRVPIAVGFGLAMFAPSPTWAQEPGGAYPGERGESGDAQGARFAVELAGGAQALGFKPAPANPTLSAGAEIGLVRVAFYEIRLGAALGYYHQPRLLDAFTLDVPFVQRFTADVGLYGDVEIVVGAEASRLVAPTYRAQQDGSIARSAAPIDVNARVGAGVAVGFDLGRPTGAPVRLFVRYRQLILAPFMGHNDVPVMGLASLTGGIAVDFGSRTP